MAKALSIRQPWAWLIVNGFQDIENRAWKVEPNYRGVLYIHAAKGGTLLEFMEAAHFAKRLNPAIEIPDFEEIEKGGIVGKCLLSGVVKRRSKSPWFVGPMGLVLERPEKIPFVAMKGQLGLFDVDLKEMNEHLNSAIQSIEQLHTKNSLLGVINEKRD